MQAIQRDTMPVHHSIKSSYMPCLVLHVRISQQIVKYSNSHIKFSSQYQYYENPTIICKVDYIERNSLDLSSPLYYPFSFNHPNQIIKYLFQENVSNQDEYTLQAYMQNIYRRTKLTHWQTYRHPFSFRCIDRNRGYADGMHTTQCDCHSNSFQVIGLRLIREL